MKNGAWLPVLTVLAVFVFIGIAVYNKTGAARDPKNAIVQLLGAHQQAAADSWDGSQFDGKGFAQRLKKIPATACPANVQAAWTDYVAMRNQTLIQGVVRTPDGKGIAGGGIRGLFRDYGQTAWETFARSCLANGVRVPLNEPLSGESTGN